MNLITLYSVIGLHCACLFVDLRLLVLFVLVAYTAFGFLVVLACFGVCVIRCD